MFALPAYRCAYGFGRARLKSYSGRISSSPTRGALFAFFLDGLVVPFFIVNALLARDVAGADHADGVAAFSKHNGHEPSPFGQPD